MNPVRYNWLDKDLTLVGVIAVVVTVVVVLALICAIPIVGHLVVLLAARMVGGVVGDHVKKNWGALLVWLVPLVILPVVIQSVVAWFFTSFQLVLAPSAILLFLCFWAGFVMGQGDERHDAKKYILATTNQR